MEKFERFSLEKATIDLERVSFNEVLKSTRPIIFDTNFLFVTFEFNLDVIEEIRRIFAGNFTFYIYEGTIDELKGIEMRGDKNKKFLPLIVKMLNIYGFRIIQSEKKYIDDQILSNLDERVVVATNDKELRLKIQNKKFKVLYMRQKSYLELK